MEDIERKVDKVLSVSDRVKRTPISDELNAKVFSTALKLGLLMKLKNSGSSSIMKIVRNSHIKAVNSSIIIDNIILDFEEMLRLISDESIEFQGS